MTPRRGRAPNRPSGTAAAAAQPLAEHEIAELQSLLDDVPAPLEPLDISALDGFLCGRLVILLAATRDDSEGHHNQEQ